jgi:uncharacterized UPF0146 family protein
MLPDTFDLVKYIIENYQGARKIVEVGIGREPSFYRALKDEAEFDVIATDISEVRDTLKDDILKPDLTIYRGADLLYSIRPNPELIPFLQRIAMEVNADLLIRPLSHDSCHMPSSMRLVNSGKAVFWRETRCQLVR